MAKYKATWVHEVTFFANSPADAQDKWQDLDVGHLADECNNKERPYVKDGIKKILSIEEVN